MQSEAVPSYEMFVGGAWMASHSGRNYPVFDPAKGHVLAHVPKGDTEDTAAAVDAAEKAFADPVWRELDPSKRGRILYKVAQTLREKLSDFARLETLNNGKPFGQAKGDVAQSARQFEYFAGAADKIQGYTIPVPGNRLDYTLKEPLGVTAHIIPWNYPLAMAARSIAPALAAGNTVVAKPASFTPLTLLKLAELCKGAGLPDGVFNVITGGGEEIGGALSRNPAVELIVLTGSYETGVKVAADAVSNLAKTVLELGGKNPTIVFADSNLEAAAQGVLNGIFTNAGQMCWAGSRLIIEAKVKEDFLRRLVAGAESMRIGNGLEPETKMGPLIAESQRTKVAWYVEHGVEEGAKVATGGSIPEDERLKGGYFYRPTILDEVSQDMKVAREEIFGPVLTVSTFETVDDAVTKANDTEYGLWAGVWTNDIKKAHRMAQRLEAGIITIDEEPVTFPQTPFGGFKESGNGSEQGIDALNTYVRVKNVSVNLD